MAISEERLRESLETVRRITAELTSPLVRIPLELRVGEVFDLVDAAEDLADYIEQVREKEAKGD